jgi:hypothetical protein
MHFSYHPLALADFTLPPVIDSVVKRLDRTTPLNPPFSSCSLSAGPVMSLALIVSASSIASRIAALAPLPPKMGVTWAESPMKTMPWEASEERLVREMKVVRISQCKTLSCRTDFGAKALKNGPRGSREREASSA